MYRSSLVVALCAVTVGLLPPAAPAQQPSGNSGSLAQVIQNSPEFRSLFPNLRDPVIADFLVTRAYDSILGRLPTVQERQQWSFQVQQAGNLTGLVNALVNAPELRARNEAPSETVARIYQGLLGRAPTPAESSQAMATLGGPGATPQQGLQPVQGVVQSINGPSLVFKADDGRTLTVDTSQVAPDAQRSLRPGEAVTLLGFPSGDVFVARYVQAGRRSEPTLGGVLEDLLGRRSR